MLQATKVVITGCLLLFLVGCHPATEVFDTASGIPANSLVEVPSSATQIKVTYGSGQHIAVFTAETAVVELWVASLQSLEPELNSDPPSPYWLADVDKYLQEKVIADERAAFSLRFGSADGFSENTLKFIVVRSARGGRTTVWHDPDTSLNYLWSVYE